jgi:hypothetical protein
MANDPPAFRRRLTQALLGSAILVGGLASYLAVLRWRGPAAVAYTQTEWDRLIPFQPGWLYIYLAPYALAPVLLALMRREVFAWSLQRALLILALSLIVFAIYPTQTIRPPLDGLDEGWTATFYRNMVAIDEPPANAAPSLHVSLTCLLTIALARNFPRWRPVIVGGVAMVWLATLFTWQHHLIDVATGVLLGLAASIRLPSERRGLSPPR